MRVEGRDLVDFRERELHLVGKRGKMRGGEMAVFVLDEMQMLDQEVAPARPIAKQRAHFRKRLRLDLPAFRRAARPAVWLSARGARRRRLNIHGNLQRSESV
jgi:hypothetical protein